MAQATAESASAQYRKSIVIDATAPILVNDEDWPKWHQGGVTCAFATVTSTRGGASMPNVVTSIASWLARIRRNPDRMLLAEGVADIERAKREGKLGVVFHFQNGTPVEYDLNLLEAYYRLGVRVIQLTYNVKNQIGDGCLERTNAGLSDLGVAAIKEMNRLGILVDLSHTGEQTTLDAMDVSTKPCVFTHANAKAICDHPRNLSERQMRRLADVGGVMGLNGFPAFVKAGKAAPTVDDLLDHLDYIVKKIGIDHAGLGLDYFHASEADYQKRLVSGEWKAGEYPPPPWNYPQGIDDASRLGAIAPAMARRGYSEEDIMKVVGGNYLRVMRSVWQA
ncbi:MAG: dipeptidase [Betaproteobacteria bacterium]